MQPVAPSTETLPSEQLVHTDRPSTALNWPAVQDVQDEELDAAEMVPAVQLVHADAPLPLNCPAAHTVQVAAPAGRQQRAKTAGHRQTG